MTPYPGPRAQAVIERMRAVEGAGPRSGGDDPPLVVESASGSVAGRPGRQSVRGPCGKLRGGHARPRPSGCRRRRAGSGGACSATSRRRRSASRGSRSRRRSSALAPPGLDRVLLGLSGSDANDTALKLARTATGRREVIAFSGGYFGRGSGVIGLNGKSSFRAAVGSRGGCPLPALSRTRIAGRSDRPTRPATRRSRSCVMPSNDPASGIGAVAAIVVEPVQGNGGVVIPPAGFLEGLRDLADRHGVVLIFDEIQAGFGRTGRLWAAEHWGVVPDLMTVGKGIGGGMAVSAVVGRERFMGHWAAGAHTSTFMGNAVNLAAGRAAIDAFRQSDLADRSAELGATASRAACDARSPARPMSARSAASACSSASRSSPIRRPASPTLPVRGRSADGVRARRPARRRRSRGERRQDLPATHHRRRTCSTRRPT